MLPPALRLGNREATKSGFGNAEVTAVSQN